MKSSRVLLIDNYDSFAFNIADLLERVLGWPPTVWRNDHRAATTDLRAFDAIVVGPGPGRPHRASDLGLSAPALRQREVPVLGVCLGHQGLAYLAGGQVMELAPPMHGRTSRVRHLGTGVLAGVPSPFTVVRYHSLAVVAGGAPLQPVAWAEDDDCVMALADPAGVRFGVQFHPESVLSEYGDRIVANFLRLAGVRTRATARPRGPVAMGDVPRAQPGRRVAARRAQLRVRRLSGPVDTWRLHEELAGGGDATFWLDSAAGARDGAGAHPYARFSVLGAADGPSALRVTHRVGEGTTVHRRDGRTEHLPGRLLDNLRALLDGWQVADLDEATLPAPFRPGFVGYLGYELKAETAPVRQGAHSSPYPDASLLFVDRAVVVDHHTGDLYAVWLADDRTAAAQAAWVDRVETTVARLRAAGLPPWPAEPPAAGIDIVEQSLRHARPRYLSLVEHCQRQIRAGESYEICLTNMVTWPERVDQAAAYRALRAASPVPFGAWLRTPELSVLGASPERFVSVSAAGRVQARPIKGTRPRGVDPAGDAALAADLAGHPKDRAENLMIVDLLRNDLHRVCRAGSVQVPEMFAVESYSTVHQLVSTVTGELADRMGALDVLASCFPGGSMTGAPKVRTMEIIDRLEGGPRGVYAGALGWIGVNGAMDTSIVIRAATWVDGWIQFGIGGAVTALSQPATEYAETLDKARALASALVAASAAGPVAAGAGARSAGAGPVTAGAGAGSAGQRVDRPVDPLLRHRIAGAELLGEQTDPQLLDHPADAVQLSGGVPVGDRGA